MICLYVVQPPTGMCDGEQFDRDTVLNWARSLRNVVVGGDERVAVGGIYPLFTPRSVNAPDPAQQAFIQQQLDAIKAQAKIDVDAAAKSAGEAAAKELKTQYDGQISDLTQKLGQAQGDAEANAAALAKANEAIAAMKAQAEQWAANRSSSVQQGPLTQPEAERPQDQKWASVSYSTNGGSCLVVTALTDDVTIEVNYGPKYGTVPAAVTLRKGQSHRVWFTNKSGVLFADTRVTIRHYGSDSVVYGPCGQIGGGQ